MVSTKAMVDTITPRAQPLHPRQRREQAADTGRLPHLYDTKGAQAATAYGLKVGLASGTIKSWFGIWNREDEAAGKKKAAPKADAGKQPAKTGTRGKVPENKAEAQRTPEAKTAKEKAKAERDRKRDEAKARVKAQAPKTEPQKATQKPGDLTMSDVKKVLDEVDPPQG
jgi:hypothetical protein